MSAGRGGRKVIVCLTGMPGAGKSTIARGLAARGFCEAFNMGDAVRAEAARRGLDATGPALGELMLDLRRRGGPDAVAALVAPGIRGSASGAVVVDGVRSNEEIRFFGKIGEVRILSVHASAGTRFGFLSCRGRSDDPRSRAVFDERDARELGVGISEPMALADESISNNGATEEELVDGAAAIIRAWLDGPARPPAPGGG